MASGLLALLDDVAAIVKVTAASLDDVAAQAVKASSKAAGVVIDDAAVTPKYVVGLSPARELPIVWNIAKGSLRNKLFILLPAIMALGALAPKALGPLLALGGLFLCFEGYEKLHHAIHSLLHPSKKTVDELPQMDPEELEKVRTSSAIRTDFILSAEIMAISYNEVKDEPWWMLTITLIVVALLITIGVYGFVGLILKADDFGLRLARHDNRPSVKWFGRLLITGMPKFLVFLAAVGTAAMLWVGGGIIIHNSFHALHEFVLGIVEKAPDQAVLRWLTEAFISLVFAIVVGFIVVMILNGAKLFMGKKSETSEEKNH